MTKLAIDTPRAFAPLLAPSRYKGAYGGRGSGKSHFFAEMLLERCIMAKTEWACVREVQKSLKQSVKKLLEDKIQSMGLGSLFNVMESEIRCPHGGIIIFQGMQNHTAESIKSLEGFDGVWVEEAQSLSQRSLDLLRPTIRKVDSELWFTWNPRFESDPIDQLLRSEHTPPNTIVVRANFQDNPWFPEVLREEMEFDRDRDKDKYEHVWLGEYEKNSDSRVFKNWVVEKFEAPDGTSFRFGADWGFSVDPTTLVRCYIVGRRLYIDYEAWMVGCEIDQTPDLFDDVPDSRKYFIRADSARPETISYMKKHGYPKIQGAKKGAGSVEDGIEFLKSFDIVVHPRCEHVIDELTKYSFKVDQLTEEVLPILADKDNHTIDALRYACEAARKAIKDEIEPRTTKKRTRRQQGWMS